VNPEGGGSETETLPCPLGDRAGVGTTQSIDNYLISYHAAFEMRRRRIDVGAVHQVLVAPEQRHGCGSAGTFCNPY